MRSPHARARIGATNVEAALALPGVVAVLTGADIGYTLIGVAFLGDQTRLSGMADTTFMLRTGTSVSSINLSNVV